LYITNKKKGINNESLFEKESKYCEVEIVKNSIKVSLTLDGKRQLKNYWINKTEIDDFGDFDLTKNFVKSKENGKIKTFLNIEDGDYVIQLGDKNRVPFKVINKEVIRN